jgi:two-component system cell cycle sensor histidine kinase/response regulator CckA
MADWLIWSACLVFPALFWARGRAQPIEVQRAYWVVAGLFACLCVVQVTEAPPGSVARVAFGVTLWVGAGLLTYPLFLRAEEEMESVEPPAPAPVEPAAAPAPEPPPPAAEPAPAPAPALVVPEPRSEFPYRELFDLHPAPMWAFDEQTLGLLAVNDAVVAKYGYTREELLALSLRDVIPPAAADQLTEALTADALGEREVMEWTHRTKAGALVSQEVIAARFVFAGRGARLVVATDLTDRRRAEAALRESEGRLRDVLATIPCGVFWKDRALLYLGGNDRVARDRGLTVAGEIVGRTEDEFAPAEEAEAAHTNDRQVMDTGEPLLNTEESRALPDGKAATLLTSRVPLRDAAGRVIGVLGVYQDVTERKRLEAQFRQAQKMEAIGRLAGGIAHDFNNLLTIITGNVHLIQHLPPGDSEFGQLIEDINDAATRAASLTRQLLTFSRKQPTRPESLDVNEVVRGMAGLLKRLIGERVTVRTELAENPLRVRADRGQLEQVVMNLAINAKDAMPEGGTLTIGTAELTGEGRFAQLLVRDTGIGMTADVKQHLFEPFFTTKDVGKGTGLGLATVYGIVQQSGGTIEVESAPGAGATFRIRLPWCDAPARSSAVLPVMSLSGRVPMGSRRSVLLVEDEDRLRKLVRFTLESQGYVVTDARSGEAALALLAPERKFDLLVTDLMMPGIDGRELATRVRAARPEIPVVFVSGYVPDHRRVEGLAGAVFLPKPFTPVDLVKAVEKAIRQMKAAAVAGAR